VGLSPFKSAVQLWLEKLGDAGAAQAGGLHLRYGSHLEPFVAQEYELLTSSATHAHPAPLVHPDHPYLFGHVDRLVTRASEPAVGPGGEVAAETLLECKTASAFASQGWGRQWTDQVPPAYLVQCAWYMMLSGCARAHLAVLIGNADFRVYEIARDRQLEEVLLNAAVHFWNENVLKGVAPQPLGRLDAEALYPREQEGLEAQASGRLRESLRRLGRLQQGIEELERQCALVRDEVASAMGPAERLTWQGRTLATWRRSRPASRLDAARLRREMPELAQAYSLESAPARRLVIGGR
jgi:putative phage-type endonuclease